MPKEVFGHGYNFLAKSDILSFEEIARLARIFISLGVEKVRLTGGEPLLRRDLPRLVEMLAGLGGLRDLTLTTNGSPAVPRRPPQRRRLPSTAAKWRGVFARPRAAKSA